MRKTFVALMILCLARSTVLKATECEHFPADRSKWQSEEVVTRKITTANAVFVGKVIGTVPLLDNKCAATIAPVEIFKGTLGKEVTSTQFDNRYSGANEDKCTKNWLRTGESYLFYLSSISNVLEAPNWFFPFCTLDSYILLESARKEISIVRKLISN